jgi:hypothetical protein
LSERFRGSKRFAVFAVRAQFTYAEQLNVDGEGRGWSGHGARL